MNSLAVRSWQWLGWRLLTQWHLYLTWARYAGAVFGGLLVLVGGCASLPPPAERAPSMALVAAGIDGDIAPPQWDQAIPLLTWSRLRRLTNG